MSGSGTRSGTPEASVAVWVHANPFPSCLGFDAVSALGLGRNRLAVKHKAVILRKPTDNQFALDVTQINELRFGILFLEFELTDLLVRTFQAAERRHGILVPVALGVLRRHDH